MKRTIEINIKAIYELDVDYHGDAHEPEINDCKKLDWESEVNGKTKAWVRLRTGKTIDLDEVIGDFACEVIMEEWEKEQRELVESFIHYYEVAT